MLGPASFGDSEASIKHRHRAQDGKRLSRRYLTLRTLQRGHSGVRADRIKRLSGGERQRGRTARAEKPSIKQSGTRSLATLTDRLEDLTGINGAIRSKKLSPQDKTESPMGKKCTIVHRKTQTRPRPDCARQERSVPRDLHNHPNDNIGNAPGGDELKIRIC